MFWLHSDEFEDCLPSSPRNCEHSLNHTQNVIPLAASDTILVEKLKQAGVHRIMADECRDMNRI